ncbi:MAG TPA: HAD family phosphatase [Burkholderiales bacterium]|nr:HAD family phosphatase [Burkholderiales bacterium]
MKVDAIVFDMGGVLVDIDLRRAFAAWGDAAGMPADAIAARFAVDEACCAHERGELDDRGYFTHLRRSLGLPQLSEEQMLAGWNAIIGEPIPGIQALVQRLASRLPLYVFSNTNPAHVAHFAPRLRPLLAHFRRTFVSCELGRRKPEAEAFARLSELIGLPPERLAFFDDFEPNVTGARRAGLQAHHVTRPDQIAAISEALLEGGARR